MIKVFTDPHFTGNKIIDEPIIEVLKEMVKVEDTLIFNGDCFESFDVSVKQNLFFNYLGDRKGLTIILTGNHDISKNRFWGNILKPFSSNIRIIQEYQYFDDIEENIRYHFFNYFRNNIYIDFNIAKDKKNILFSHCDINTIDEIPEQFKVFDHVYNGHIHMSSSFGNVINIGAMRKCTKIEQDICRYLIIKNGEYEEVKFESPIDIKELFVSQLNDFKPVKNTVLTVLLGGLTNPKEIEKNIRALPWYDENHILLKPFKRYLDEDILTSVLNTVKTEKGFDILELFRQYITIYADKFGNDFDQEKVNKTFFETFKVKYEQIKKLFEIYNIEFNSIECSNFKLFTDLNLSFDKFNTGIIAMQGRNFDELNEANINSSNEAGKSCIRQVLEYLLLGTFNPLRWGTKSGFAKINFKINSDVVEIEKVFNKTGLKSCIIKINNKEEWKDETNSNKISMFFEKYNFQNAIQFFLISDVGLAKYFFSAKNSEKFKIFRTIFPIIQNLSEFISEVKIETDNNEKEYESLKNEIDNIVNKRKVLSDGFFDQRKKIIQEKNILKVKELENEIDSIVVDEKLMGDSFKIRRIASEIENENVLKAYSVYKKKYNVNELFTKKEQIEKLNNELKQQNIYLENNKSNTEKLKNSIESELNKESEIKMKLEKILTDMSKDRLLELKNLHIVFNILDKIKRTKNLSNKEINDLNNFDFDNNQRHKIIIKDVSNLLVELNKELNKLQEKKIETENKYIECPSCKFKIKNEALIKEIDTQIKKISDKINVQKEALNKFIDLQKTIEEQTIVNTELINYVNHELEPFKLNLYYFCSIIMNESENKKRIENYSIEYIDSLIQEKEKELILKNELQITSKRILQLKKEHDNYINEFNKISGNIELINKKITEISFDDKLFEELNIDLESIGMNRINYSAYELRINDILKLGVIDSLEENDIKIIEQLKYDLEQEMLLAEKRKMLEFQLKYEKEKEIKLESQYSQLLKIIIKENNQTYIKEKVKSLKEKELKYNEIKLLYDIMTNKRTFNFEKFFITVFFDKLKSIFNVFLKYVFSREIELNIDDNNFNFKDSGNILEFGDFSNGAKSKIEACLLLVINIMFTNYGINSNILLIDEFLDRGVDQINLYRVLTLIKQFFNTKKCFLISHKNIEDFIDQTLIVERRDGESRILI